MSYLALEDGTVWPGESVGADGHALGETVFTTNRCCAFARGNHDGTKEKGYFLCTARDGKFTREFVEVK